MTCKVENREGAPHAAKGDKALTAHKALGDAAAM